jgi:hypothetical protein
MLQEGPQHAEMRRVRGALPAAGKRGELLAALAAHAVVVISGATGCGKSTQVGREGVRQPLLFDIVVYAPWGAGGRLRQPMAHLPSMVAY